MNHCFTQNRIAKTLVRFTGALLVLLAPTAYAEFSTEEHLKRFFTNSREYMSNRDNVKKYIQHYTYNPRTEEPIGMTGESPIETYSGPFPLETLQDKSFIQMKDRSWAGKALIGSNDRPEDLLGPLKYTKLKDMNSIKAARLKKSPWSSSYWPFYVGVIAARYTDDFFPFSADWAQNRDYVLQNPSSCSLDDLSPAEKYDLLVGDTNQTLTKAMFEEGAQYHEKYGKVERWMGICDGWAAASYSVDRPRKKIIVRAKDGKTQIPFYPDDIKALASLNWAKSAPKPNFVGGRCNIKDPATDENGRVIEPDCFDTNPGSWHLAIVNAIGVQKRSFVIDATYDYEVWNQPVYSYEYTYFNPLTGKTVPSLNEAQVTLEEFTPYDRFRKYRSAEAATVVGISMKLIYIAETSPTHEEIDRSYRDRKVAVNYLYDLELDSKGTIIGGEWYHNLHPDFMWTPPAGARAKAVGDLFLARQKNKDKWTNRKHKPVPDAWAAAALASASSAQPLERIVEELVQKSHKSGILGLFGNHLDHADWD